MNLADQVKESIDLLAGILEQEERNLDAKLAQLERQLAAARMAKEQNGESIERAARPVPREDICPVCWVMLGIESSLTRPDGDVSDETRGLEVLQCSHVASGLRCKWRAPFEG